MIPESLLVTLVFLPSLYPHPQTSMISFAPVQIVLHFKKLHLNVILQYVLFSAYLLSFSMILRFTCIIRYINSSFPFITEQYSIMYIKHNQFIHLPVDRHQRGFQFRTITNKAAMSIGVHIFVWTCAFVSPGYLPRLRNAGSYGTCKFNSLKICHLQCWRTPVAPHPCQHSVSSDFFKCQPFQCVQWYITVFAFHG